MRQTSHDARRSLPELSHRQAAVLSVLGEIGPSTDEHLVAVYRSCRDLPQQSPSGIRTRRKELADADLVVDTGRRERTLAGRMAIVWTSSGYAPHYAV
jgi:hypothetical protein